MACASGLESLLFDSKIDHFLSLCPHTPSKINDLRQRNKINDHNNSIAVHFILCCYRLCSLAFNINCCFEVPCSSPEHTKSHLEFLIECQSELQLYSSTATTTTNMFKDILQGWLSDVSDGRCEK